MSLFLTNYPATFASSFLAHPFWGSETLSSVANKQISLCYGSGSLEICHHTQIWRCLDVSPIAFQSLGFHFVLEKTGADDEIRDNVTRWTGRSIERGTYLRTKPRTCVVGVPYSRCESIPSGVSTAKKPIPCVQTVEVESQSQWLFAVVTRPGNANASLPDRLEPHLPVRYLSTRRRLLSMFQ